MKKHIANNLSYWEAINGVMTQQMQEYISAAVEKEAEIQALKDGDKADKELYKKDYEQWRNLHRDRIDAYAQEMTTGNAVAQIYAKNMHNAVISSEGSMIITGAYKAHEQQYEDIDSEALIGTVGPDNLKAIADTKAPSAKGITKSASQLNYQPTRWRVAQTDEEIIAGIQNAADKGKFVAFDSETLGGQDKFGKQRYDAVTEITFKVKKYNEEAETIESYGTAIGLTGEQRAFGEQVLKKIKAGAKLTGQEEVWAHRLALIGKSETQQVEGRPDGVFEYSHFADKDEILKRDADEIEAGLNKAFSLGEDQRRIGENVTYGNKKMYAWEAEVFRGIDSIINEDLTAVGHNTVNFDRKALQWLLQRGMWSAGARQLAEERLKRLTARNGDLHFDHEVDTEAVQNQHSDSPLDNYIVTDDKGEAALNRDAIKYAKDRKLSYGQQEAIGNALYHDMYNSPDVNAHTSDVDVDVVGKMFTSSKYRLGTEDSFLKDVGTTAAVKGDGNELFYMTRSHTASDLSKNGLLGFVADDVDENAITSFEGVTYSGNSSRKLIYKPGALQKGVSYAITNVSALNVSKELQEQIAKLQPEADMSNLVAVEWTPVWDENIDPGMRKARKVVTVGARFNQESLVNESAFMYATKDANGEWQFTDNQEIKDALAIRKLDEEGKVIGARQATVGDMLKESSESLRDAGALRANREYSLKKDLGLLQYAEDMKAWGAANGTDDLQRRFYEAVSAGQTQRGMMDYFGYVKDGEQSVESPTLSAAMGRLDYLSKNEQTIRAAAELALEKSGSGLTVNDVLNTDISKGVDKTASYYYKSYMGAVVEAAKLKAGKGSVGVVNDGMHVFELNNVEIDMNGFNGKYDYTEPFRINLNARGKSTAKSLAKFIGAHTDMNEDKAVALLAKFQKFLVDSPSLKTFGEEAVETIRKEQLGNFRIDGNSNVDFAYAQIVHSLAKAKKEAPAGGKMTSTERYNLLAHKNEFDLGDKERADALKAAVDSTPEPFRASAATDDIFAKEATEKVLFGGISKDDVKKQLLDYGYSEHDAEKMALIREQQLRDTRDALTKISSVVRQHGGQLGMDAKSGTIWIDANGRRTVLDRLPQNVVENGMSYIKAGNQRFHAPLGFYATNTYQAEKNGKQLEYKFMSRIGAEFDKRKGYLNSSMERAAARGQLGEGLQEFIGQWANDISQASSISAQDFQEMRMAGDVNIGGILPLIARDDVWNDLSSKIDFDDPYKGPANRALRAAVEKIQAESHRRVALHGDYKDFSADVGLSAAIRDIMPELHNYLGTESQDIMRGVLGDNYQDFSVYTKTADRGNVSVFRDMHQFGGGISPDKRGPEEFSGRANKFYTDGKALDGEVKGVQFGHAINTAIGRTYEEDGGVGVSRGVNETLRTGRFRMTTGTMKQLASNNELSELTRDMLHGAHFTEGAAIMDPRLADAFFTTSKAIQRINDKRVLDIIDGQIDHLNEKNKMAAQIKFNKDGTIGFKYSKGLFVETEELGGSSPFRVKGMTPEGVPVEIKETGLMRMGFFSRKNNLLASEEDVQKLLNRQENVDKIAKASDKAAEAYRILNETYGAYYYNIAIDAKSNLKMEEYKEKGMHDVLFGYLGSGGRTAAEKAEDAQMAAALKELGVQELQELIPHRSIIESLKSDDIANTALGAYLEGKTNQVWTHDEILQKMAEGMRKAGANLADDEAGKKLYDIAVRERYGLWDEAMGVIKKLGGYTDEQIAGYHAISNFFTDAGTFKHNDLPTNVAVNLFAKGYSASEVAKKLEPAFGKLRITKDKDGVEVLVGDPQNVNLDALHKIAEDEKLENMRTFWSGNGKSYSDDEYKALSPKEREGLVKNIFGGSVAEYSRADDSDRARASSAMDGKFWKYDYRSQAMSSIDRYSQQHLDGIKQGLIKALGNEKEAERIYNKHFGNTQVGDRTGEGFFQDLERSRWYTPGEKRVLIHGDLDTSLLSNRELHEIADAYASLEKDGISREFTNAVVEEAKKGYKNSTEYVKGSNADYVSIDKIKAYYSAHQHNLAAVYNKGGKTMDEIVAAGFNNGNLQTISLNEVFTPDSNFQKTAEHLYGKSVFLDLQINGGKGPQIYENESQRYIALPWTDQHIHGEDGEVLKNQYQSVVSKMRHSLERYQSGVDENQKPLRAEKKKELLNNLTGYADEVRQAIIQNLLGKNGIVHRQLGTAKVGMSYFGKAYGHELWGNEQGFWGNISFDGKNVSEMYKNGAIIDYQAASLAIRSRFYDDKYFRQIGLHGDDLKAFKKDVFERLKTSGTLSTNSRNPQGYDKSTSAAAMYFTESITGNELKVSAAMWESKKGDYDSDEGIAHVLTGDAVITKKNGQRTIAKIDYATYEQLQSMAESGTAGITDVMLSSHTKRMFDDAKAQIWGQAVTRNKLADENVRERVKETGDAKTEVMPEYDFKNRKDLAKESLEGKGRFYEGEKHYISGAEYHQLSSGERAIVYSDFGRYMEEAKNYWEKDMDKPIEDMSEAEQRNMYTGYIHQKYGLKSDKGEEAMNALGFVMTDRRDIQDAVAMKRKAAAGQMNNAVFRLFQVADASGQFAKDDTIRGIGAIHTALNEAFLSPKNEGGGFASIDDINNLRDAANNLYGLLTRTHPNKQQIKEADEKLGEIAYNVLEARDFKELRRYVPGFNDAMNALNKDEQKKYALNYIGETIAAIGRKVSAAGFDMNAFDIGMKDGKKYTSSLLFSYGGMQNSSMNDMPMQNLAGISETFGKGISVMRQNAQIGGESKSYQRTVEPGANYESNMAQYKKAYGSEAGNPLRESAHAKPPTLGDVGNSAVRALSNIKISGNGILKGGLAVAAGLAVSGIAGGVNTTSPQSATTQAAGASEALQEQPVPHLSDSNMNVLRGGPQSGYVINISAGSPQGSDAAREAITQALGSSVPVNTSMNISMNTNYQDQVNQLQISRILGNMM